MLGAAKVKVDDVIDRAAAASPEGKTSVEGMRFEPERLSYESSNRIAASIAQSIQEVVKDKEIVLGDISMFADLANVEVVLQEIEQLAAAYDSLAKAGLQVDERRSIDRAAPGTAGADVLAPAVAEKSLIDPPFVAVASTVLNAGLGLMSLFRQDVNLSGTDTKIDALTFLIELGRRSLEFASKVWIVDLYVPFEAERGDDTLQAQMAALQQAKAAAWSAVAPMVSQLVRLDVALEEAGRQKHQEKLDAVLREVHELRRDLQPVSNQLTQLDRRLSSLEKRLMDVDSTSGLTLLARLLRAESLSRRKCLFLHAAIVSSGGYSRTIRNFWRTMFSGDGVTFQGGAVVRWALLASDKGLIDGGMETATSVIKE